MTFEAEQSHLNRTFQANMSNTAHQREVSDLRGAGLNPILSATGGPGASTPSGAKGSGAGYQAVDAIGNAVSSAMAGRRNKAEVQNIEADERLKDAQRGLTNLDANLRTSDYQLRGQQLQTERARTAGELANASILESTAKGAKIEGEIDQTRYGSAIRYMQRGIDAASGAATALRNLRGGFNRGSGR